MCVFVCVRACGRVYVCVRVYGAYVHSCGRVCVYGAYVCVRECVCLCVCVDVCVVFIRVWCVLYVRSFMFCKLACPCVLFMTCAARVRVRQCVHMCVLHFVGVRVRVCVYVNVCALCARGCTMFQAVCMIMMRARYVNWELYCIFVGLARIIYSVYTVF